MFDIFDFGKSKRIKDAQRIADITKAAEKNVIKNLMQSKNFTAGMFDPTNSDWLGSILSPNQELKQNIKLLKIRARDLFNNSPVVKSFVSITQQSLKPFKLTSKVTNARNGYNTKVTSKIENAWDDFCKAGNFEVSGRYSLNEVIDQMIIQLLIDGEILLRKVKGRGKYGYQLQLLHTDQLMPETHNTLSGPYQMSIERDEWDAPVAYWINTKMPTEGGVGAKQLRLPAEDVIHAFLPHAVGASRGVPLIASSMSTIQMLDSYRNAVIVAAKMAACTSVTYEQNGLNDTPYDGAQDNGLAMFPGVSSNALSPGMAEALPPGVKKVLLSPNQPTQSFPEFNKNLKKEIAAGVGLSYNILYSDWESTSFSSTKACFIQDRAYVNNLQAFFISKILDVVFSDFIDSACALGKLDLPAIKTSYDIYKEHAFIGKAFDYLDPLKDVEAQVALLAAGLTTYSDLLNEHGKDFEEVLQTRQKEKALMAQYGFVEAMPTPATNPALGKPGSTPNTPELEQEPAQETETPVKE